MKFKIYNTKQEVAEQFSMYLRELIKAKGTVHIALSGGSTPKIVFDELANNYKDKIDWTAVHLYWGDERCVPPATQESNYKMTADYLLSKIEIPKANIHRIMGENTPDTEAKRYGILLDKELPRVNDIPRFDLVILGLGDDGHTASIFPHEIYLWNSKNNCEVAIHPESGQQRITITGRLINNAREVVFLVTGANKAEKVYEIINKKGNFESYPGFLVAPVSGNLLWFLDVEAAKKITSD